jgi:hypothetical protein
MMERENSYRICQIDCMLGRYEANLTPEDLMARWCLRYTPPLAPTTAASRGGPAQQPATLGQAVTDPTAGPEVAPVTDAPSRVAEAYSSNSNSGAPTAEIYMSDEESDEEEEGGADEQFQLLEWQQYAEVDGLDQLAEATLCSAEADYSR